LVHLLDGDVSPKTPLSRQGERRLLSRWAARLVSAHDGFHRLRSKDERSLHYRVEFAEIGEHAFLCGNGKADLLCGAGLQNRRFDAQFLDAELMDDAVRLVAKEERRMAPPFTPPDI